MKTRIGVALWAAGLLLAFSGYGDDSDGVETDPGESPPVPTPGQTVTTWRPKVPAQPGEFDEVCAVTLQRVGQGAFSADVPALKQALAEAVGGLRLPGPGLPERPRRRAHLRRPRLLRRALRVP